jgi:hypothetical protein
MSSRRSCVEVDGNWEDSLAADSKPRQQDSKPRQQEKKKEAEKSPLLIGRRRGLTSPKQVVKKQQTEKEKVKDLVKNILEGKKGRKGRKKEKKKES